MKHEENWNEEVTVYRETMYGIIDGSEIDIECWFRIVIQDESYGFFEWGDTDTCGDEYYCEGGLWFNGDELTDFDGCFDLCPPIRKKLIQLGYRLD